MNHERPTARQREVLRLVLDGLTMREIGARLGMVSTNAVADFTHALIRKGLVEQGKAHRKPRGLRVTDAGLAELGLKKCGECGGRGWDEVL